MLIPNILDQIKHLWIRPHCNKQTLRMISWSDSFQLYVTKFPNICDRKSHSISLLGSSNGHLHDAEQFFWLQFFLVDLFRLFQTCVNYSSCYTIAQFVARCIPCIWSFSCHKHNMKYLCLIHSPCSSATMFSCALFNTAFCGIWFSAGISVIGLHTFNIWPNLC